MRRYEFALDHLPVGRVDVARLSIQTHGQLGGEIGSVMLVLDAGRDEFMRLPLDPLEHGSIHALGHDGRHLLLKGRGGTPRAGRVGLYALASGDPRWFGAGPDGSDHLASLSPDGRHIAALNFVANPEFTWDDDPEPVAIGMIDTVTGGRHRAWTGPRGGWGAESAVRWSPDGAFIALSFDQWMPERADVYGTTVVLDRAANVHGHFVDYTSPDSNGAWLDERRLLLAGGGDDFALRTVDVTTGDQHSLGPARMIPLAAVGDRIVMHVLGTLGDPARLETTALDGSDPQPFITIHDAQYIFGFDLVPSMWT